MARDHARISIDIADDDELEDLSTDAQWLYFRVLLPDPSLNHCGVADWRPRRLAVKSRDMTPERLVAAAAELEASRFAIFDEETEEVLVRSFIRNDHVLRNPKVAVALLKAYRMVASKHLKSLILAEVAREYEEHPEYSSWTSTLCGDDLQKLLERYESDTQSDYQSDTQSDYQSDAKSTPLTPKPLTPKPLAPKPLAPSPTSAGKPASSSRSSSVTAATAKEFEEFWTLYPRKIGRKKALEKFAVARRNVDLDVLLSSVERYVGHLRATRTEERFIKHPATWLNQGCWDDVYETSPVIKAATGQDLLKNRIIQRHSEGRPAIAAK
ncbi:MerR-like HTH DNA binding protein [Gordonia phage BrutonGaster]|uniref:MerR-like HTH DNA binding protein n=1 Tax=Gordonia phage BrutonGaster TaxID=2530116 RepID=A0A482JLM1_9CAUD|nr:replication initiation protein [Gordonia phage BrutonGaster]QBP33299.1 MerR-like HTH DNA binding protein [Gordonia phage BrutonGaster]